MTTTTAVYFVSDGQKPMEKAWLELAQINSYTEDYRCYPTLYLTTPYSISHGSSNNGGGRGTCPTWRP